MSKGRHGPPDAAPPSADLQASRQISVVADEETTTTATDVTEKHLTRARQMVVDRAIFTMLSGPRPGSVLVPGRYPLTIGRSRSADVPIDDPGVSRVHARIVQQKRLFHAIEDLESSNGTFVNGKRVDLSALSNGDRIQLGPNVLFRFTLADAVESELQARLYTGATTDSLTGLANRDFAMRQLEVELAYCRRHGADVAVVMMDVDHFKEVNDRHGHAAGDALLTELGKRLLAACRLEDVLGRFGGEEFLLILRGSSVTDALPLAERIRVAVESTTALLGGAPVRVTASFGVAAFSEDPSCGADELIQRADRRLYAAKRAGRNCVVGH